MDALTIITIILVLIILIVLAALSIRIVKQWERVVVLYLGRFVGIRGPGLIVIMGVVVVFVALSLWLPYFNLVKVVH